MFEILATKNDEGRTLYKLLEKYLTNISKSRLEKIFRKKDVKLNGKRTNDKSIKIVEDDRVVIYGIFEPQKEEEIIRVKHNLNVIYEDENILLIDKEGGVVVHGEDNSLDNQVLSYLKFKKEDSFKPSHVGRLDKETSGLILYAKNYKTLVEINNANDSFIKKYLFKSDISLSEEKLHIKVYISKDVENKRMKAYSKEVINSKLAETIFYLEGNDKIAEIKTGRKHQIRATLKFLQKPIYGDRKYSGKKDNRLMLHSFYLQLNGLKGDLKYLNKKEFWTKKPKW
ncbi:ribosomal large subunit pseudouridine synthase C [Mycoplasmopsis canis PG 14]|uniref:RNA pseudouridylate synthase n=1 Tax=Mycoplasmopsis canis TaxID=29555 RepID=A0A449AQI0_9BACT|nr:RluA family pseudouridine synthase [Mycoplasmopsis canis]AMD81267.1 RNA pseudouridine synthase [Mycoplasmopsis canis PG 14]EIE40592.1 ribosomal large subunit pseudouridine synthase C [Mycoplasmopsis canis PG 14]VEU68761.1 ribosomal large subunit pseudouridylate synthase C [Mycoplasmopsis canis]